MRDYALNELGARVVWASDLTSESLTPRGQFLATNTLKMIDRTLGFTLLGDRIGGPDQAISQVQCEGKC